MTLQDLKIEDSIKNSELMEIFKCPNCGGMRYSKTMNTLILIANYTTKLYNDREVNGIYYYTGMGQRGDQSKEYKQNGRLLTSKENSDLTICLFEVRKKSQYTYCGLVRLSSKKDVFQEEQEDLDGCLRKVWIFPLEKIKES